MIGGPVNNTLMPIYLSPQRGQRVMIPDLRTITPWHLFDVVTIDKLRDQTIPLVEYERSADLATGTPVFTCLGAREYCKWNLPSVT
jgi:hypothetical protein